MWLVSKSMAREKLISRLCILCSLLAFSAHTAFSIRITRPKVDCEAESRKNCASFIYYPKDYFSPDMKRQKEFMDSMMYNCRRAVIKAPSPCIKTSSCTPIQSALCNAAYATEAAQVTPCIKEEATNIVREAHYLANAIQDLVREISIAATVECAPTIPKPPAEIIYKRKNPTEMFKCPVKANPCALLAVPPFKLVKTFRGSDPIKIAEVPHVHYKQKFKSSDSHSDSVDSKGNKKPKASKAGKSTSHSDGTKASTPTTSPKKGPKSGKSLDPSTQTPASGQPSDSAVPKTAGTSDQNAIPKQSSDDQTPNKTATDDKTPTNTATDDKTPIPPSNTAVPNAAAPGTASNPSPATTDPENPAATPTNPSGKTGKAAKSQKGAKSTKGAKPKKGTAASPKPASQAPGSTSGSTSGSGKSASPKKKPTSASGSGSTPSGSGQFDDDGSTSSPSPSPKKKPSKQPTSTSDDDSKDDGQPNNPLGSTTSAKPPKAAPPLDPNNPTLQQTPVTPPAAGAAKEKQTAKQRKKEKKALDDAQKKVNDFNNTTPQTLPAVAANRSNTNGPNFIEDNPFSDGSFNP